MTNNILVVCMQQIKTIYLIYKEQISQKEPPTGDGSLCSFPVIERGMDKRAGVKQQIPL